MRGKQVGACDMAHGAAWHADDFVRVGNRTECALLELCSKLGVEVGPLQEGHQIVQVYPFSSDRKRMTSITFQSGAS